MGASLEPWKAGRGGLRGPRFKPRAEINVTPFVDVMLVLLIVFMIAAPLLTVGVPVDLPKTEAQALNTNTEPLTITITDEGVVFLQETEIDPEEIVPKLIAIVQAGGEAGAFDERIFIRADDEAQYGRVMEIMARVNAAGFTNLGLVTDPLGQ